MAKTIPVLGVGAETVRVFRAGEESRVWEYGAGGEAAESPENADGAAEAAPARMTLTEALVAAAKACGTREFVLAAPLSRLLVDVVRTPADERENRDEAAGELLDKSSPFPDEMLVTSAETVAETDAEIVSLVAAWPEASRAELDEALTAAKVRIVRTDAAAFGWLRTLWPKIGTEGRKLVAFALDGACDLMLLDNGALTAARGVSIPDTGAALAREAMLTALEAGSAADIGEVVVFSAQPLPEEYIRSLAAFGPVRREIVEDAFGGVAGVAERAAEGGTLDVTPEPWSDALAETRFTKKTVRWLAFAGTIWFAAMAVLLGVPVVFDYRTDAVNEACKRHKKAYEAVKLMKERVDLVKRYSDHARGALEILKAVSDRLPTEITLTAFQYQTLEKLTLAGESEEMKPVLEFKDELVAMDVFADVTLRGPTQGRGGKWRFSIEATFEKDEDAESGKKEKGR